jgi:hypothetical protein
MDSLILVFIGVNLSDVYFILALFKLLICVSLKTKLEFSYACHIVCQKCWAKNCRIRTDFVVRVLACLVHRQDSRKKHDWLSNCIRETLGAC